MCRSLGQTPWHSNSLKPTMPGLPSLGRHRYAPDAARGGRAGGAAHRLGAAVRRARGGGGGDGVADPVGGWLGVWLGGWVGGCLSTSWWAACTGALLNVYEGTQTHHGVMMGRMNVPPIPLVTMSNLQGAEE